MISWKSTPEEHELATKIAHRAVGLVPDLDLGTTELVMDVLACHLNGCPLKLRELLEAPNFDFSHDVFGIRRHIDRKTGALTDCFVPRLALPFAEPDDDL